MGDGNGADFYPTLKISCMGSFVGSPFNGETRRNWDEGLSGIGMRKRAVAAGDKFPELGRPTPFHDPQPSVCNKSGLNVTNESLSHPSLI